MDTPTVTVREWTDVVRRARLGKTTKLVALVLATYADYTTGTRVHPGIARIVVDAELGYKAVQKAMHDLRAAGLVEMTRQAARRGDADEYRLTIGPDVLEHVEVLSPAAVKVSVAHTATTRRGRYRTGSPADLHPSPGGADPVDNPDLHPLGDGAGAPVAGEPAPPGGPRIRDLHPFSGATCTPPSDPPPPRNVSQELPTTPAADVDLNLTPRAAAGPAHNQLSPDDAAATRTPRPRRCAHGLSGRYRADGQPACGLCRATARIAAFTGPAVAGAPS